MGSCVVVVPSPGLDRCFRIDQAREVVLVQTLVPKFTVEALDESILHRLSWLDERESDTMSMSPEVERLSLKLGSVVTNDRLGKPALFRKPVKSPSHPFARK